MPLTGQAKKDYQREYMREYMRNRRAGITVKTPSDVKTVTPETLRPVEPETLRPVGGRCQYCKVKLPPIATCCNACARLHD